MSSTKRIHWLDTAKGVAILSVVLAHNLKASGMADRLLFSYALPLFFFVSGYLFDKARYAGQPVHFFISKIKSLAIPYWIFAGVFCLQYILFQCALPFTGTPTIYVYRTINNVIVDFFYGSGRGGVVGPLWFIPCLFFLNVIFFLALRVCRGNAKIACGFVFILVPCGYFLSQATMAGKFPALTRYGSFIGDIDISLMALGLFAAGFLSKELNFDFSEKRYKTLAALVVVWLVCLVAGGFLSWNDRQYFNPIVGYVGCIAGCIGILICCPKTHPGPLQRAINFVGCNSLLFLACSYFYLLWLPEASILNQYMGLRMLYVSCSFLATYACLDAFLKISKVTQKSPRYHGLP